MPHSDAVRRQIGRCCATIYRFHALPDGGRVAEYDMEFHYNETDPDVLVLIADKDLDSHVWSAFAEDLQRVIDSGARKLVIDCSRLGYVSSIGIATLIRLYKRVVEHGGHVKLVGVQGPLARLLEITRLNQVFQTEATLEDALAAFRAETERSA